MAENFDLRTIGFNLEDLDISKIENEQCSLTRRETYHRDVFIEYEFYLGEEEILLTQHTKAENKDFWYLVKNHSALERNKAVEVKEKLEEILEAHYGKNKKIEIIESVI